MSTVKKKVATATKRKAAPKKKVGKKLVKKEDKIDTRLSYSSGTLIKNCEQKYFYYKVSKVPKDKDSEQDNTAFNVGKCFHFVMEENGHTEDNLITLLDLGCKAFEVEDKKALIHAMLLRYLQVHKKSGLKAIKCELSMSNKEFLGFIDVILSDEDGYWYICDLKTAARYSEITAAKLHNDVQLNLYTSFYEEVAGALDLDVNKFMGARYRVTTKATLKQKATETYVAFVKRLAGNVKSYDVIIPLGKMKPEETYKAHMRLHQRSLELRAGEVPNKNSSWCDSYFRPCEYWSQCHGSTYTECRSDVEMLTSNNV